MRPDCNIEDALLSNMIKERCQNILVIFHSYVSLSEGAIIIMNPNRDQSALSGLWGHVAFVGFSVYLAPESVPIAPKSARPSNSKSLGWDLQLRSLVIGASLS